MESLSIQQARKLVLHSQKLPPTKQVGGSVDATLSAIEHLGYIQLDTISVIERAHHHTLWNRNPRYKTTHLDQLLQEKKVFEYWSHAASYLPMQDYRFSLPCKQAIVSGEQGHWYERDKALMKAVRDRIVAEGPLMSRDFDGEGRKIGEWRSKPAKRALEYLFMQGELMVPYRENFHKVYDLTERVLPENIDTSMPSSEEYGRFLVTSYLRANGIGRVSEMVYLRRGVKQLVAKNAQEMVEAGEVLMLQVGKLLYLTLPDSLEMLNRPLRRSRLKILSPFDNLLIQRGRTKALFDFDYVLECYVPAAKRKYGYFSLPVLWDGKFAARIDCKADRKKKVLHIYQLILESETLNVDGFATALCKELVLFLKFNNCDELQIHRCGSQELRLLLQNTSYF